MTDSHAAADLERRHGELIEKQARSAVPLWAILVLLGLVLTAVIGAVVVVNRFQDQAQENCEGLNDLRQANLNLWRPILVQLPPDATPEQHQQAEAFQQRLEEDFALVDCR